MTPDTDAAWTLAVDTPVVNGRDWHPEVLRKVLDAEQRVEPTEWMRLGVHGVPPGAADSVRSGQRWRTGRAQSA